REYYERKPDAGDPTQLVSFGTSGHRGSPFHGSFTQAHPAAITQAICDYRRGQGIDGPLYMGKDTHCLSDPAQRTALEVLAANGVDTIMHRDPAALPLAAPNLLSAPRWKCWRRTASRRTSTETPASRPRPSTRGPSSSPS